MVSASPAATRPRPSARPVPRWAWAHIGLAALAMVATLPGRTHGLGLITEPLLAELSVGRVAFASVNLWATLLGALFCIPCGWLIDRAGVRPVLAGLALGLGGVVLLMSRLPPGGWVFALGVDLFVLVLLTRGLGQSALSVASLALMGRSAGRRSGPMVGVYSFLVALGFMGAFAAVKAADGGGGIGWRDLWASIGWGVAGFALLAWVAVRPAALRGDPETSGGEQESGLTLRQALRTGTFWAFALASSLYLLAVSGITLFNQSILAERGFDRDVFLTVAAFSPLVGLASNLLTGLLARYVALGKLLAAAMGLLAAGLLAFEHVETLPQVYLYATVTAAAGGMVTVLFFAVWAQAFGTTHLGQVQGAAQMMTVLASAAGPLVLAWSQESAGSYVPAFRTLALVALGMAVWALFVGRGAPGRSLSEKGSA
ncbi:MAG TPA: MFS transporter [Gemmataceae bacterium]